MANIRTLETGEKQMPLSRARISVRLIRDIPKKHETFVIVLLLKI
jgi:hypothetical protein